MTRPNSRPMSCGLAALLAVSLWVAIGAPASAAPITWSLVASPNMGSAANELISVSCPAPDDCTAVGYAISTTGIHRTLAESWNGSAWTVQSTPNLGSRNNNLSGVSCTGPTSCVAVGYSVTTAGTSQTLTETWNGTAWSIASSPAPGSSGSELTAVSCTGPTSCVAVGDSVNEVGAVQTLGETWDGSTWSVAPTPNPGLADNVLNGVSCTGPANCVAAGYSTNGVGTSQTLVETWDGSAWSTTPSLSALTDVSRVFANISCVSPSSCVAVGWLGAITKRTLTAIWDGTAWTAAPSLNRGSRPNTLSGVSCTSPTSCVAAGSNETTDGSQTVIETWDGTAWSLTPSPNPGTVVNVADSVSCPTAMYCVTTGAFAGSIVKRTLVLAASSPPDVTPPTVSLATPADGAYFVVGQNTPARYHCADEATGSGVASCVGTAAAGSPIDTSAAGVNSFGVTATDGAGNSAMAGASYRVVEPLSASSDLPAGGGSVTTDPGAGPAPPTPITTTVASADAGPLHVDQGAVTLIPPSGFDVLGMQIDVVAPTASPGAPLTFVFDVDAAMLVTGTTPAQVSLLKDAALVPACANAVTLPVGVSACVTSRVPAPSGGGDVRLTAISATGGQWNIALGATAPPSLTISDASAPEGNAGSSVLPFTVSLSQPAAVPVTVNYATAYGTATAGSDYTASSGTLTFPPGQAVEPVPVTIAGDTVVEPDETLLATLSLPSGATIARATGLGTVRDDDAVVPGAPSAVRAVPGDASANLRWTPGAGGGRAIGGYVITPYIGGVAQTSRIFTNNLTTRSITGLTNRTKYTFTVAATNSVGTGPMSAASAEIVIGAPVAPKVSTVGSSKTGSVSWSTPASNGAAVTSYVVSVYKGGTLQASKTHKLTCAQPCTPLRTWTVTGLTNGQQYTFQVVASNGRGAGVPGSTTILVSATQQAPGRPPAPTAKRVSVGIFLSWVRPTNGTATITKYVITPYQNGVAQRQIVLPPLATTYYDVNISNGHTYRFKIAAGNAVGTGSPSPASNAVTPT